MKLYLYLGSKEKIKLKEIQRFIENNFGKLDIRVKNKDFVKTKGLLFDALNTNFEFEKEIPARLRSSDSCHIAITDKLITTYDDYNKLHIRAAVFGYPSVISISGIVEGPAKPKEYYIFKQRFSSLGIWHTEEPKFKHKLRYKFIDYKDKRLTEVIKGYIAQGLFFFLTGEPFCENKSCRLFNSHWQEDLIYSQVKVGKFCKRHKKILKRLRSRVGVK